MILIRWFIKNILTFRVTIQYNGYFSVHQMATVQNNSIRHGMNKYKLIKKKKNTRNELKRYVSNKV